MTELGKFTEEYDEFLKRTFVREKSPQKKYQGTLRRAVLAMNMTAWFGLYLFVGSLKNPDIFFPDLFPAAGIVIYYLLIQLIRNKAHTMWRLTAGHMLLYVPVVIYVVRGRDLSEENAAFFLVLLTACFASSVTWFRRGGRMVYYGKWYLAAEAVMIYLWGFFGRRPQFTLMGLLLGIVLMVFHLWCTYLSRFLDFAEGRPEMTDITTESIYSLNTKVIGAFLGAAFVLMLLAVFFQYDGWLEPLKEWVLRGVRRLVWLIRLFLAWIRGLNHPQQLSQTAADDLEGTPLPIQMFQTNNIVLALIGAAAVSTLFVLGIREFVLKLQEIFARQPEDIHRESILPDTVEDLSGQDQENTFRKLFKKIFKDNRERVRYQFKRRVLRNLKKNIRDSETAMMLNKRVKEAGKEDITALTGLYQVARYGGREITAEEMKLAAKSIDKIQRKEG